MKLQVFAIYDAKVQTYNHPIFLPTRGAAIRVWEDTVTDKTTSFSKHPADYTLFHLGEYDDQTGTFENFHTPVSLGTGLEATAKKGENNK